MISASYLLNWDIYEDIYRTKIENDKPNYVVINNNSGRLSWEQYLWQKRGGFETDVWI